MTGELRAASCELGAASWELGAATRQRKAQGAAERLSDPTPDGHHHHHEGRKQGGNSVGNWRARACARPPAQALLLLPQVVASRQSPVAPCWLAGLFSFSKGVWSPFLEFQRTF
jgi:hypothetical protein